MADKNISVILDFLGEPSKSSYKSILQSIVYEFFSSKYYLPSYKLMVKTHTNIEAVTIFEEACEAKDFFILDRYVHDGREYELRSMVGKYYAVN